MKYAAFHYDYPFSPESEFNIGDYIQSLAAIRYLPCVDFTVDRDSLTKINSNTDQTKLIGNSWYQLRPSVHVIPSHIDFLPVSIHINNHDDNIDPVLSSWAHFGPIGCRDLATMDLVRSYGYDAYFSSCLTTTLTRDYVFENSEHSSSVREGVLLVDVMEQNLSAKIFPFGRYLSSLKARSEYSKCLSEFNKVLKFYEGEKIERITHMYSRTMPHEERFALARKLLKKYATAKLVITSRIHCALPCLALGTPVILMTRKYDALRYKGLYKFLNHIGLDEDFKASLDINYEKAEVINKNLHLGKVKELTTRCEHFVCDKS